MLSGNGLRAIQQSHHFSVTKATGIAPWKLYRRCEKSHAGLMASAEQEIAALRFYPAIVPSGFVVHGCKYPQGPSPGSRHLDI